MLHFSTIFSFSSYSIIKYDLLIRQYKKYLKDKFRISFVDKINNSDMLRNSDFVYLRLTYPHKLIFYNKVVDI